MNLKSKNLFIIEIEGSMNIFILYHRLALNSTFIIYLILINTNGIRKQHSNPNTTLCKP